MVLVHLGSGENSARGCCSVGAVLGTRGALLGCLLLRSRPHLCAAYWLKHVTQAGDFRSSRGPQHQAAAAAAQQQQQCGGGGTAKPAVSGKQGNVLPLWGNEKTMNLNPMILTNILSSPYFKVQLYELKTYHEVVDEIYFKD
ncbi:pre-mRNA-splicing factor 38B-like [Manis pentadactyla]|uniref:pre-mRNA-splicing factor 38B-like n=1 Tax=Manis pentadactyla TaxID=143292 RepID=UPI00255C2AA5|nr:pre-mRNA-splicing factor 38B-like [Manis pentadactyla]